MPLPRISGTFRIATDPELRFTPSGMAICDVRAVAVRRKQQGDEWVDANSFWTKLTGFKKQAENMAESFKSGDLVVVIGDVETQEWTDNSNNKRIAVNVLLSGIGHATDYDGSSTMKAERGQARGGGGQQQERQTPPPNNNSGQWTGGGEDEPPF